MRDQLFHQLLFIAHISVVSSLYHNRYATHIDFNFPPKEGTGIRKLIPHVSDDCHDLIEKLV